MLFTIVQERAMAEQLLNCVLKILSIIAFVFVHKKKEFPFQFANKPQDLSKITSLKPFDNKPIGYAQNLALHQKHIIY